jgi:hypothetical protein
MCQCGALPVPVIIVQQVAEIMQLADSESVKLVTAAFQWPQEEAKASMTGVIFNLIQRNVSDKSRCNQHGEET